MGTQANLTAPSSLSWTPEELHELDSRELDDLARGAGLSLTLGRLLLGRCLVELDGRCDLLDWGFAGAIHYAVRALRISRKAAREARRVARELQTLPVLSAAAEEGGIGWSHLREVVRVALPETEEAWLEAARTSSWKVFHRLVSQSEPGDLPGQASPLAEPELTEVRALLSPGQAEVLTAGMAWLSRRLGRLVPLAEALEYAFAELLAGTSADPEARLRRAQALLEDLDLLRERQEHREDARALAAARQARRRAARGEERPTRVASEDAHDGRPTRVACGNAPDERPTRVADRHAHDERPTRVACGDPSDERPTRVASEDAQVERPTRVHDRHDERPTRVAQAPIPRPPFAYPAPASGDSLVRDGLPWEEAEPSASWAMISAVENPCPGNPALTLAGSQRRPFWEPDPEPDPAPEAGREARRAEAIHRGARTRRGSAETRRTVLRRDGFACMTPDCPHTVWLHSHHLTLYCQGGLSVPAGLVTLCSRCHRNVHRGSLRILGTPETGLQWLDRRGLPLGEADAGTRERARGHARRLLAAAVGAARAR